MSGDRDRYADLERVEDALFTACGSTAAGPTAAEGALYALSDLAVCCLASSMRGPIACTCWVAEYDEAQARPDTSSPGSLHMIESGAAMTVPCEDCAYRPGSPERSSDPDFAGDPDLLARLPATGVPFYCHSGMRRVLRWRHPAGIVVEAKPGGYEPPIVDGVPYRANGGPAFRCAGWAARAGSS